MRTMLAASLISLAFSANAEVWVTRDKGKFQFEEGPIVDPLIGLKSKAISFGEKIVASLDFRLMNHDGGQQTITGSHNFHNRDNRDLYYVLYVTFFNEDDQIIATDKSQTIFGKSIEANSTWRFQSASELPTDVYKQIHSFEAVIYVSDSTFNKKF